MNPMQFYLIEPKGPLIIRSSRPFEEISDAEAARFPPPSTLAGALRNVHARTARKPLDEQLLKIPTFGPLAVKLSAETTKVNEQTLMVPKPADAHYFRDPSTQENILLRATPQALAADEGCDLPAGLQPVQLQQNMSGKPVSGPPWWSLADLLQWRQGDALRFQQIEKNGWTPAPADIRTHIAMNQSARTSESGQIFQTTGLSMWQQKAEGNAFPNEAIGLLGGIAGDISNQAMNLGGERRLADVTSLVNSPLPAANFIEQATQTGGLCLTLLTPALFKQGWLPGWLSQDSLTGSPPLCPGVTLQLKAAAVERWQPQSGWDLKKGKPRAARRMVPAGATYWFDIIRADKEALQALWFAAICDDEQDNKNGFGLALPSAWHNHMETNQENFK